MIVEVTERELAEAARIHAESWQESHRSFCTPEFLALHSVQHQKEYLRGEQAQGKKLYMLVEREGPVGIVSVQENLIENLYVLPCAQKKGYGSRLLQYAMEQCTETPVLWILEHNTGAYRLYYRRGFRKTGRRNCLTPDLWEIKLQYSPTAAQQQALCEGVSVFTF